MAYKYVLFDLDGTLSDSEQGIISGLSFALAKMGLERDRSYLRRYLGPPMRDMMISSEGFTAEEAEKAVALYREYYAEKGLYENYLYPGMAELLAGLYAAGVKSAVATTKPRIYAERILRYFGIDKYFAFVSGSELDGARSDKKELIEYVMENMGADAAETVMVGDRSYDALGAREAGVAFIGVLYGYGSEDEFMRAGVGREALADTVEELSRRLLG